jgi:leucine dehydrogenase
VGADLAHALHAAGAELLVSDVDPARVAASPGRPVDPADVVQTECDVYAPCAVGGTIDAVTVEQLRCRVVAGAANNQLADPALADRLHERGILYAPDYVINSGGVLHGAGLELLGWDDATLESRLRGLGDQVERRLRA